MTSSILRETEKLLKESRIRPSKGLGQNFLISEAVIENIIQTADLGPNDIVLEIGAGTGILTKELAKKAKRVITIEKDARMVAILQKELEKFKNVKVVHGDTLRIRDDELPTISYKLIANLPYYITTPVIRKSLESSRPPKTMVLMVQKEVAQKIVAKPPKTNLLAVSVHIYARPKIVSFVSKESFWPKPRVDSAILQITPLINADKKLINTNAFFKILKAGFSQPRKQLLNNFSNVLKLKKEVTKNLLIKQGIDPTRRAGTITIEEWIQLTENFSSIL
ncbi:MAG: Ribosomal RNA small subunit methyltransferase A [Parcubacteria group bacterium GW2011_GWC1_38_6]|nr:MAG: Ribosomal RNA small subunit methyltransferase A [Parcubacteria group bacterium GW2011_GWA1_36_12]KKQ76964.1 MAG: Ribosomal RNA small subunit methyltransferase A [Parcubacteria group bacterium GW2011_GWC1_38_6]